MTNKWILIVDDESGILSVLKSSLRKLGDDINVVTAGNGAQALAHLRERPFELVITDYKMEDMDGLQLLAAVRALRPNTRTILMTAYGNEKVEAETRRLQTYRYLIKPLQIDDFRQVVKEALTDQDPKRPGIMILSDDRYQRILWALKRLQMDVGARCVVLADVEGSSIAHTGSLDGIPINRVIPLLGGCFAGLHEAGQALDGNEDTSNLIYRESPAGHLYIINIGAKLLLIIVINRGAYSTKLGTVWYAAQQVASMLNLNLVQEEYSNPEGLFGRGLEKAVGSELDKLLQASEAKTGLEDSSPNLQAVGHSKPEDNDAGAGLPDQPPGFGTAGRTLSHITGTNEKG